MEDTDSTDSVGLVALGRAKFKPINAGDLEFDAGLVIETGDAYQLTNLDCLKEFLTARHIKFKEVYSDKTVLHLSQPAVKKLSKALNGFYLEKEKVEIPPTPGFPDNSSKLAAAIFTNVFEPLVERIRNNEMKLGADKHFKRKLVEPDDFRRELTAKLIMARLDNKVAESLATITQTNLEKKFSQAKGR